MPRTRQSDIEAVALMISQWPVIPGDKPAGQLAREINDGDGWTIHYSAPLDGVLYIEGVHLSDDDLAAALRLADTWRS